MSSDTTAADHDEFEDLLATSSPTDSNAAGRRGLRGVAAVLALAMLGLLVLGLAWALSRPAPGAQPTAGQQDAKLPVQHPAPQPTLTGPASRDWPVPATTAHGPQRWTPTQASGFSRTDTGAAVAAANIAGRLDPYHGPAVYRAALRQTVGYTRTIQSSLDASYRQAAATLGIRGGRPIPASAAAPAAAVVGWQADGCRNTCVVRLLTPWHDSHIVHEVPVVWRDGDWRVRLTSPTQLFTRINDVDPAGYQPFPTTR